MRLPVTRHIHLVAFPLIITLTLAGCGDDGELPPPPDLAMHFPDLTGVAPDLTPPVDLAVVIGTGDGLAIDLQLPDESMPPDEAMPVGDIAGPPPDLVCGIPGNACCANNMCLGGGC